METNDAGFITAIRRFSDMQAAEAVVDLVQKQLASHGARRGKAAVRSALENALREGSRSLLFCRYADEATPIAFAFANICSGLESGADYLWINELFVAEGHRRRNIAGGLLEHIEAWAGKNAVRYIALTTGSENAPAQRLYSKKGYRFDSAVWIDKVL